MSGKEQQSNSFGTKLLRLLKMSTDLTWAFKKLAIVFQVVLDGRVSLSFFHMCPQSRAN